MNRKIFRIILYLLLIVQIISSRLLGQDDPQKAWEYMLGKYPIPENAIHLEHKYSFPSEDLAEKDIYLWRPTSMDRDSDGNIYISDQRWGQVFKFDQKGKFIKRIGRKGQGPGEFQNPYCLSVTNEFLIVSDTNVRKIHYFSLEGRYLRTINVRKAYFEFISSERGQIYAAPLRMGGEPFLIDVFNYEGETIRSFGELRYGEGNVMNFFRMAFSKAGEIIITFQYFPTICKYSRDGKLISTYRIEKKFMRDRAQLNLKSMRKKQRVSYPVTAAIASGENAFYTLSNYPRVFIYEFDAQGNLLSEYYYASTYDLLFTDFFVIESDKGEKTFFLLQSRPECKVEVLSFERNYSSIYGHDDMLK